MRETIANALRASSELKGRMAGDAELLAAIERSANLLLEVSRAGGTLYVCGNGGSACDSMHFVEELVARYRRERPGIRARHLLDPAILSCWANDYEYETVFSRQVETLCGEKDALFIITTSGKSGNILRAAEAARKQGTKVIGLLGKKGGPALGLCDVGIVVPADATDRIQEAHITIIHILCDVLETTLFPGAKES